MMSDAHAMRLPHTFQPQPSSCQTPALIQACPCGTVQDVSTNVVVLHSPEAPIAHINGLATVAIDNVVYNLRPCATPHCDAVFPITMHLREV